MGPKELYLELFTSWRQMDATTTSMYEQHRQVRVRSEPPTLAGVLVQCWRNILSLALAHSRIDSQARVFKKKIQSSPGILQHKQQQQQWAQVPVTLSLGNSHLLFSAILSPSNLSLLNCNFSVSARAHTYTRTHTRSSSGVCSFALLNSVAKPASFCSSRLVPLIILALSLSEPLPFMPS